MLKFLRLLRDKHLTSTLVLHHPNKARDGTGAAARTRGTTAINTSMDGRWFVEHKSDWSVTSELFHKEGVQARKFKYRPVTIDRGVILEHRWLAGKTDTKPIDTQDRLEPRVWQEQLLLSGLAQHGAMTNADFKAKLKTQRRTAQGLLKDLSERGLVSQTKAARGVPKQFSITQAGTKALRTV